MIPGTSSRYASSLKGEYSSPRSFGGKEASMLTPFSARRRAGFTLIELLVVIAIIAILTAIIFPVFATVRENSRQQSSIAAMHQIQTGLAQFKLDQGVYPPVLFGYALPTSLYPSAKMDNALQLAEQQKAAAQYFPGLYPEYVNNPLTFTDPNNPTTDLSKVSAALPINSVINPTAQGATLATSSTYPYTDSTHVDHSAVNTSFYLADAFDISPEITATNQISSTVYIVRYQTNWTDISTTASADYDSAVGATPEYTNYNRQLRWTNPPADTYVTSTTYHVPNDNRVLVLWQDGPAKSIDASRFLAGAAGNNANTDTTTAPAGTSPADTAKFWQVSPTTPTNPGP
jgi:prepilin-type N-terminal cleavage/methylation domain-containing protein